MSYESDLNPYPGVKIDFESDQSPIQSSVKIDIASYKWKQERNHSPDSAQTQGFERERNILYNLLLASVIGVFTHSFPYPNIQTKIVQYVFSILIIYI
jgi:hypothetical protein